MGDTLDKTRRIGLLTTCVVFSVASRLTLGCTRCFFFTISRPHPSFSTTSFVSILHGSSLYPRPHRPITYRPLAFFFFLGGFVCFSTRRKTRAFIFSCTRFLDNSFPVLLWGNKSALPRVLLRPLISGAGNEMRWLSSRTTSLSWFPLFPCWVEAAGDGREVRGGPRRRDSFCCGN